MRKVFYLAPSKLQYEKWKFRLQENVWDNVLSIFKLFLDLICSSSDGRLCLVKSSSGKVKVRIDGLFGSKSTIGSFVSLDAEDKLLATGNEDGDVKVLPKFSNTFVIFFRLLIFLISNLQYCSRLMILMIKYLT